MTQRRASTPQYSCTTALSPSRRRVGNRLPPRGELSPAEEREGENDAKRSSPRKGRAVVQCQTHDAAALRTREFPGRRRG